MSDPECSLPKFTIHQVGDIETLSQIYPQNITALKIPKLWTKTKGRGIVVAILDTGIQSHPDLVKNIDFSKCRSFIDGEGIFDDFIGHGCIEGDSLIYTNEGIEPIENFCERYLNIENITDISAEKINTYSLNSKTGQCEINPITHVHRTFISDDIVEISLTGNIQLRLTKWHPVYVKTVQGLIEKKRADELCLGDYLIIPSGEQTGQLNKDYITLEYGTYLQCQNCQHILKYNRTAASPNPRICKKCRKKQIIAKKHKTIFDEGFAYLLGIIVTDGHIMYGKNKRVEISSTTPEILDKCYNILKKNNILVTYNYSALIPRLLIYSKDFVDFCIECGVRYTNKTYDQTVPWIISKSPKTVINAFLGGVIDGDGCISKTNVKNRITSASLKMIKELCMLMNSLGINSSYQKQEPSDTSTFVGKVPVYNVVFSHLPVNIAEHLAHPSKIERSKIHNGESIYPDRRKIINIDKKAFTGVFYDLTVENATTYLANGIFVSNTHVAGTVSAQNDEQGVVGVAPEATIVSIKVLDKTGFSRNNSIVKGLTYCLQLQPDIINMSLGGNSEMPEALSVIQKLIKQNTIVVASAGNTGKEGVTYPAFYDEVISVGSYSNSLFKDKSIFSSYGKELDILAPGEEIFSTFLNGQYSVMSGSSMSTPHVSGVIALLLSYYKSKNRTLSVDEVRKLLLDNTSDIGAKGFDKESGWGIIDPDKLFSNLLGEPVVKKTLWQKLKSIFKR